MEVQLKHFLLTRFSYRGNQSAQLETPRWRMRSDPLARRRLEARFKLFELLCVPSILNQTVGDFSWIFIVDPALPSTDRERILQLTSAHKDCHLVEFDSRVDITQLQSLKPYIAANTSHVVTTNIDDDDVIWSGFVEYIQSHLRNVSSTQRTPTLQVIGCADYVQWDFLPGKAAPLGYLKRWHRGPWLTNAGYTLCCKYPEYDATVLGLNHRLGDQYFDPTIRPGAVFARLRAAAEANGDDWRQWSSSTHVHRMRHVIPQVVVTNHVWNDAAMRLLEAWDLRRPIAGPMDIPQTTLDFARVAETITAFRYSPSVLLGQMLRMTRAIWIRKKLGVLSKVFETLRVLAMPVWVVVGRSWARGAANAS